MRIVLNILADAFLFIGAYLIGVHDSFSSIAAALAASPEPILPLLNNLPKGPILPLLNNLPENVYDVGLIPIALLMIAILLRGVALSKR